MSRDQFDSVLRGLGTDFGTWSREDVITACARVGWIVGDSDVVMPEWEGGGWLDDVGAEYLRADPALAELGVHAGYIEPHLFREYVAMASAVWGTPSFHGGDVGVFVRWRDRSTTRELSLTHGGSMYVSAFSTYAKDSVDEKNWDYNEYVDEVPSTWLGELGGGDMVGFVSGHHLVDSWTDLTTALTRTLRDLQLGMIALGNPLTDNDGPLEDSVVITLRPTAEQDDRLLQILLSVHDPAIHISDDTRWHDELVAHGFHPDPRDPDYQWLHEVPVGDTGCTELATLAVTFLQIFGLELDDVTVESWRYNDPYQYFTLTCVGVPETAAS
ncbi:hypothetical protein [Nocardia sp. NPDC050406]|uniref:hypothetical protein n=1 Tax=Nocardia sp. NPDC050406 TaxID=3364318 RepID=UPI00379640C0